MEIHALKTWVDLKIGGAVEVEDDVQSIVRQIREIDPRLHVYWNEQSHGFDIVESCLDGTDRLVFSVPELDARVVSRLREADTWLGGNPDFPVSEADDFLTRLEADQKREQDAIEQNSLEKVRDAGERLAWALGDGKYGPGYMQSILVEKDIHARSDDG